MKKLFLIPSLILADQAIKYFFYHHPTINSWLVFSCNPVIAWSLPLSGLLFWLIWLLAISALFFFTKKNQWNIFLVLCLAGALSNALDRLIYGCVVDYIQLFRFPVFNLADILISGGVILFLFFGTQPAIKKNSGYNQV